MLERTRLRLSERYIENSWILRIFIGGMLNIMLLYSLQTFITNNVSVINGVYQSDSLFTHDIFPLFSALLVTVLSSPFILSLALTRRDPELKIVPPFYIAVIGIVWIFAIWIPPNSGLFVPLMVFGFVLGAVGHFEDGLVTSILGVATERESIYFEHLRVYGGIENVKARLSILEIMNALHLSDRVEGDAEQGYKFHTKRNYDYVNIISLVPDRKYPEFTEVKIIYYEKSKYSLRSSPDFLEHSKRNSRYISEEVFLRREPMLPCEVVVPFTNTASDPLINSIIDELHGYYMRYRRLPLRDSVKIVGLLGIAVITVGLFLMGLPDIYWQASIVFDVFIYLSEIPDILRRK